MFTIEFIDHTRKLDNEFKSKLLKPESELYKHLRKIRQFLIDVYPEVKVSVQRMDFHIELVSKDEAKEMDDPTVWKTLVDRATELQGKEIKVNLVKLGKAVVVPVYDRYHITVAHYQDGVFPDFSGEINL